MTNAALIVTENDNYTSTQININSQERNHPKPYYNTSTFARHKYKLGLSSF